MGCAIYDENGVQWRSQGLGDGSPYWGSGAEPRWEHGGGQIFIVNLLLTDAFSKQLEHRLNNTAVLTPSLYME